MKRLIDAEILTDYFVEHDLAFEYAIQHQDRKELERLIAEIPTAYDPDKVAEQLEEIKTGANTNCRRDCSNYDWSTGSCQGLCEKYLKKRAIEIVKAGGADAEH